MVGDLVSIHEFAKKYVPHLFFSKGEKYLPCDIFFAGIDIKSNKEMYDKIADDQEKIDKCICYYNINEGKKYDVYQYWLYYAYNPFKIIPIFITDDHEHDLECVKVFVGKKSRIPEFITCNIHSERQIVRIINGLIPDILVEDGGHGMLAKIEPFQKPWYGFKFKEGGHEFKPSPKKQCKELMEEIISNPEVIDNELKLVGNDYGSVGKMYAPNVPWARWEYYKPEDTLLGFDKIKTSINSIIVGFNDTNLPEAIMQSRQKMYITKEQYNELGNLIPGLKKDEDLGPPTIETLFRQPAAQALSQINIHSIDDVMSLNTKDIRSSLGKYIKENKIAMRSPNTTAIKLLKDNLDQFARK